MCAGRRDGAPRRVSARRERCRSRLPVASLSGRVPARGARMPDVLLPGITSTTVRTSRLTQSVLHADGVDPAGPGEAVLFVHGNVSSSLFWQQTLLELDATGRHRALAVDLRGYGE